MACAVNNEGPEQANTALNQELIQPQYDQMRSKALVKKAMNSHAQKARATGMISSAELSSAKSIASPGLIHYAPNGDVANENYAPLQQGAIQQVATEPVSTFSIDVDTGSYSNIRRMLNQGTLPPTNAVRLEEMINYFSYQYDAPRQKNTPFSIQTELATSPWSSQHTLLKIGLKAYEPSQARPAANLVFLLDVSGSMNAANKLPLLKKSLLILSKQLSENDKVSIVVYAGASGLVLEPTAGNHSLEIEQALERLSAGGSTNGHAGIHLAYQVAQKAFIKEGINRIILATDGDFNVGTSDVDSLKELIALQRDKGISLTTLGFGSGNYNDHLMEQIADVGNGNYAYIDTLNEARKVLVETLDATLLTIAGSYTPFLLVNMRETVGWPLLAVVWGIAFFGVFLKLKYKHRLQPLRVATYIVMGWLIVLSGDELTSSLPEGGLNLLILGGVIYTVGVIFYVFERIPYNHAIWHVFVLGGSVCHFFSVYLYVLPQNQML